MTREHAVWITASQRGTATATYLAVLNKAKTYKKESKCLTSRQQKQVIMLWAAREGKPSNQ